MERSLISIRASDNSIVKLECYDRIPSITDLARSYARSGYPDRYAVIAECETNEDPDARGVYMSLILRPSIFPAQAGLLSSLAAVALATALEEHTTKPIGIGWVSSIYCNGKQIGGASIEGKLDNFTTYEYIIVNFKVKLSERDFPPRVTDLIKKVFEQDNNSVATIIAKNILSKFFTLYPTMKNHTKFMNVYRQKFVLSDVKVKHITSEGKTTCKVLSIEPQDCSLIVEMRDKSIKKITTPTSVIIPKSVKIPKK